MPIPVKIEAEEPRSAKERVYDTLLEWLIYGTILPGEKLNEMELAAYFNVSRTPVREALMLLAADGFVDVIPNRGSFASRLSMTDADAVYTAISAVQSDIARLACGRCREADRKELERMNEAYIRSFSGEISDILRADEQFHDAVAKLAGNPYLLQFLLKLQRHVYRFERILSQVGAADLELSARHHQELIDAIAAGDEAAAATSSSANWMGQYRDQRPILEKTILDNGWGA